MGLFKNIFQKRSITFTMPSGFSSYIVSNSKKNTIALSCIDIIATSVSSIPIDLYKKSKGSRTKITNHPTINTIKYPNIEETRSLFYQSIVGDYFNEGNIYLFKYFNDKGELYSLFRLDPTKVNVKRNEFNQKIFYYNGKEYTSAKILHIPSRYGYNGLVSQSIFEYYSEAFILAKSLDTYFKNSFKNGLGNGKRLVLDLSEILDSSKLSKEQIEEIKNLFINDYVGYANADRPILKTLKNTKYETIDVGSSSNKESQLNENMNITQELICKVFNVPSSFLKGENKYGEIESLYQIFLDFAVKPLMDSFIESFNNLLSPIEQQNFYFEPNYNTLARTSLSNKIDAYTKELTNGILSINEVRAKENLPSIGVAGDYCMAPSNLLPVTMEVINARLATQKLALQEVDKNQEKQGEY